MKVINTPRFLENLMKRISLFIVTLAVASGAALADSNLKSGLGGALGGAGGAALGNAIGGSTGAVVGGAVGGATGAAVTTKGKGKTGAVVGGAVGGGAGAAVLLGIQDLSHRADACYGRPAGHEQKFLLQIQLLLKRMVYI